jgi:hypothetical protein
MDRLFIFLNITLLFVRLRSLCIPYTDWYTVHWLRVYCTLTQGILYTDWGYTVHWLRVYRTLTCILYTDWGYTVHWLVYCTLTGVYCTLTEGIPYTDLYTVHWAGEYCTLTEGIPYTDLYTVHWPGYTVHWLVYCTLTEGILYTDWGNTVHWLRVYCTMTEVFINLTEVFQRFFLSCKANATVKLAKTGHGPHSSKLFVICVVLCIVCV